MVDSKKTDELPESNRGKQLRALRTREELLHSARKIFARDGFEHTSLEAIACDAGKTRGAFYANFKDKEDAFCAIFEDDISRDMERLRPLLLSLPSLEQRIEALGEFLGELGRDRERTLLNLEFKLYAIRHPKKHKRLANLYAQMRLRSSIPELDQILGQLSGSAERKALVDSLVICGIVDGLALGHLFDPNALSSSEVGRYLKLCVRESLQPIAAENTERRVIRRKQRVEVSS
jgi:AcrR family transcriptional regulator